MQIVGKERVQRNDTRHGWETGFAWYCGGLVNLLPERNRSNYRKPFRSVSFFRGIWWSFIKVYLVARSVSLFNTFEIFRFVFLNDLPLLING